MKKIVLHIIVLFPCFVQGQSLSIEELWHKLTETNTAQQQQLNVGIAHQNLTIERTNRYPVVYGESNLQRNLITPTTPVPAIAFNPTAQPGSYLPLKFATQWNTKAGIAVEWSIFAPKQKSALNERKLLIEKAVIEQNLSAQALKKEATLSYTSVVLASIQYQTALADSAIYAHIVEVVSLRYKAGRETAEQFLLVQQEFERQKIQLYEAWSVLEEANLELQKYVDLFDIQQLTSGIEDINKALRSYKNIDYDTQLNTLAMRMNDNDKHAIKSQVLPSLTLNAYYGAQFFNRELNLFQTDNWYGNSYANIVLRVPISAFLLQQNALRRNTSDWQLNSLKVDESVKVESIQQSQHNLRLKAAEQKVQGLKKIFLLSSEHVATQRLEYDAGRILWSDYNRTLSKHNTNLKELWQAEFDLISRYLD